MRHNSSKCCKNCKYFLPAGLSGDGRDGCLNEFSAIQNISPDQLCYYHKDLKATDLNSTLKAIYSALNQIAALLENFDKH